MSDVRASVSAPAFAMSMLFASLAACTVEQEFRPSVHAGDARRGKAVLVRLECGVCHVIPGVPGAVGQVGPALDAYAHRSYVAGKFPNDAETLVRFVRDPPAMAPLTGMPAVPMSDQDARDIAAYLYELE
jgi:cytochrome c2